MTTILPQPDSTTAHVNSDTGKPTKDFYNWLRSLQTFMNDKTNFVDKSAWTTYTPVITAGAGTLTTVSANGRYKQTGKTVFVRIAITITTNGSGAAYINSTLPVASFAEYMFVGRENSAGKMLQGITSGSNLIIQVYDGTYPGFDGAPIFLSGAYEAA